MNQKNMTNNLVGSVDKSFNEDWLKMLNVLKMYSLEKN